MDSISFNSHGIFSKISIYLKHRFLWQQNTSKQICILLDYLLQQRPNWESSYSNWATISSGHWSRSVHTIVHNGPEYISRPLLAKFCSEGILFFRGSLWDFFWHCLLIERGYETAAALIKVFFGILPDVSLIKNWYPLNVNV